MQWRDIVRSIMAGSVHEHDHNKSSVLDSIKKSSGFKDEATFSKISQPMIIPYHERTAQSLLGVGMGNTPKTNFAYIIGFLEIEKSAVSITVATIEDAHIIVQVFEVVRDA